MTYQLKGGMNVLVCWFEMIESNCTWLHIMVRYIMMAEAFGNEDSALHSQNAKNQNFQYSI